METESPETSPPDLYNDEDADDVQVSEEEGWGRHESANHIFAGTNDEFDEEFMNRWDDGELVFDSPDSQFMDLTNWIELHPAQEIEAGQRVDGSFEKNTIWEERVADIVFTHPDLFILYAWIHAENPTGVFSPGNPQFNV